MNFKQLAYSYCLQSPLSLPLGGLSGYLQLLTPYMLCTLNYISWSGCLGGISLQLSLAQDLLSMMTLHIYCFYVYAAKLEVYSVPIYTTIYTPLYISSSLQTTIHAFSSYVQALYAFSANN